MISGAVTASIVEAYVSNKKRESGYIGSCSKIESEIAIRHYEEREMFLNEIGLEESGVSRLIKAHKPVDLQTF